jgi:phenylalanyl-tRNA synthetase beta chain
MDIKILDSSLREHLHTKAKPRDIAKALSLTSASVEKIETFNKDFLYHIEVTSNRIDMACVYGIAREAAATLPQFGFDASVTPVIARKPALSAVEGKQSLSISIQNKTPHIRRICAVILNVKQKPTPKHIKDTLVAAGIRSINNLIDITNYIMHEIGHPTHAFDYDRLNTKKLTIRQSIKGEKITTLDKKEHTLPGGDIIAENDSGAIVDLLGIMGTENSAISDTTTRILFFINNINPSQIRKTSMTLNIRTQAAAINEKNVDPELAMTALLRGIELYQQTSDAKIISDIIDIYPKKWHPKTITVSEEKINQTIGVKIPLQKSAKMLERLNFKINLKNNLLTATIPSFRDADINIPEDLIEEIARIYGYHNLPGKLPATENINSRQLTNTFYWEGRTKEALKYWGFTEIYTYSLISAEMNAAKNTIKLKNPLDIDHAYMRSTLIPSLLKVLDENKSRQNLKIFELAKIYLKKPDNLPDEIQTLSAVIKGEDSNFFNIKGIIEQLSLDIGIKELDFQPSDQQKIKISISNTQLGEITLRKKNLTTFELNFDTLASIATPNKTYTPLPKYPPIIEDLALIAPKNITSANIIETIKKQSPLIKQVNLLDKFEDTRTFHITYQSNQKNLTSKETEKIRNKIMQALKEKFSAYFKT